MANGPEDFKIEEVFESAVTIVKNLPQEGPFKPSDKLKLKLYALYKQATLGPNTTSKPRFYQIVEQYKWDAWMQLGDMPRDEAMEKYIHELKQVMESIPADQSDPEESRHFEEVLGKKFYDYWFNEWEQQKRSAARPEHQGLEAFDGGGDGGGRLSQSSPGQRGGPAHRGNGGDSQSSDGSSVSMLEETQSHREVDGSGAGIGDGYKTPTSLLGDAHHSLADRQMSDQFALAVLRLQHGLDQTDGRVAHLEEQMSQSMASLRSLESALGGPQATIPKQLAGDSQRHTSTSTGRHRPRHGPPAGGCLAKMLGYLGQAKTIHWFYLSYPILVYVILRAIERRRQKGSSAWRSPPSLGR